MKLSYDAQDAAGGVSLHALDALNCGHFPTAACKYRQRGCHKPAASANVSTNRAAHQHASVV
jgi:hypothetical protein